LKISLACICRRLETIFREAMKCQQEEPESFLFPTIRSAIITNEVRSTYPWLTVTFKKSFNRNSRVMHLQEEHKQSYKLEASSGILFSGILGQSKTLHQDPILMVMSNKLHFAC
jgi:hypothetical protein